MKMVFFCDGFADPSLVVMCFILFMSSHFSRRGINVFNAGIEEMP